MNLLTQSLPDAVGISGRPVQINTDYRIWVEFEQKVLKKDVSPNELIRLCYGSDVSDPQEALEKAVWFYCLGKEEKAEKINGNKLRCYDFEQDAPALIASFRSTYSIDLLKDNLHWWAFRTLMLDLPPDCAFCKIVEYRTIDTKGMTAKQKKYYADQKKRYALKVEDRESMTLEQRNERMKDYVAKRFRETEENRRGKAEKS